MSRQRRHVLTINGLTGLLESGVEGSNKCFSKSLFGLRGWQIMVFWRLVAAGDKTRAYPLQIQSLLSGYAARQLADASKK